MDRPRTSPFPKESGVPESPSSNIECIPHHRGQGGASLLGGQDRGDPGRPGQRGPWEAGTEGTLGGRDRGDPGRPGQRGPWEAGTKETLPPGLLSASQSVLHGAKATLDPVASGPSTSGLEGRGLPWGFPGGIPGTEPACQCRRCKRHGFDPWVGKSP